MKIGIKSLLFFLASFVVIGQVSAGPISCNVNDATANGAIADTCAGDDDIGSSGASETAYVESVFSTDLDYLGKYEEDGGSEAGDLGGYQLTVTIGDGAYSFDYTVTVPDAVEGAVVDFVLGVKQANDSFIAYLFEDVTLGIDGSYNSFWINPAGKDTIAYSHISGWITTPTTVPEPGTLSLLAVGLLALGFSRRSRK